MNISSIVVQCLPEYVEEVVESLKNTPECDYHIHDEKGRVIITIEGDGVSEELQKLKVIEAIPHVITADMQMAYSEDELDEHMEVLNNRDAVPKILNEDDVDVAQTSKCKPVEFSGKGSYDDQSEDLQYNWTDLHGNQMSSDEEFKHRFSKKGLYEVTLTVTDKDNLTAVDKVCILSGLETMPLLADAGADITAAKDESVTLSGRAVCRDDVASYEWKEGDSKLSDKPTFSTSKLPVGEHTLKLIVTDFEGKRSCDKVKVTVK